MNAQEILKILEKTCHISGECPLIVGVSGGTDSLCLISVLASLKIPVIAAHYDHKLRPESKQDALFVAQIAKDFGCRFALGEGNVREIAQIEHLNIESSARRARYAFLFDQARKFDAEAVVTGHTADDQVETILLHILRGSGLDGLKGMSYRTILESYSTDIPLIRPLLGYWREDTAAYCREHDLTPIEDLTNQDRRYSRNRIRHELVPILETYNSQVKKRLWTLGQVAQSSRNKSEELIKWIYQHCLIQENPGESVSFDSDLVADLPTEHLQNLLKYAFHRIGPENPELDFKSIQRAVGLLKSRGRMGKVDLGGNIQLEKAHRQIYIHIAGQAITNNEWPQIDYDIPVQLNIPGKTLISASWSILAEIQTVEKGGSYSANPAEAWIDFDAVTLPLIIRRGQPGDRLQPLGMNGSTKLSDFFINQKIPRPAREKWPMVLCGDEIIWAAGLRISEKYRLKSNSRQTIHLQLIRN